MNLAFEKYFLDHTRARIQHRAVESNLKTSRKKGVIYHPSVLLMEALWAWYLCMCQFWNEPCRKNRKLSHIIFVRNSLLIINKDRNSKIRKHHNISFHNVENNFISKNLIIAEDDYESMLHIHRYALIGRDNW